MGAMGVERLQKVMAAAGICSRRQAETLLRQGLVRVNGALAMLGDRADPASDLITVRGQALVARPEPLLLLVNKPPGVLCSCRDPRGRPTVLELLPAELRRGRGLHPVGRLDADSRGALLLSNRGDVTLRLSHPRYGHRKTYRVWVEGRPAAQALERWAAGVPLNGQASQPVGLKLIGQTSQATELELVMAEGRNRQIRRTAAILGHPVLDLKRWAIGSVRLGDLPEGRWRRLDPQEWQVLNCQP